MFKKIIEFLARLFKRNKNKENEKNEKDSNRSLSVLDDNPEELTMIDCVSFEVEEITDDEENDENSFTI